MIYIIFATACAVIPIFLASLLFRFVRNEFVKRQEPVLRPDNSVCRRTACRQEYLSGQTTIGTPARQHF